MQPDIIIIIIIIVQGLLRYFTSKVATQKRTPVGCIVHQCAYMVLL